MKIIAKGRGKGKTTELIKMSAEKQIPIVCRTSSIKYIKEQAKQMNLKIPEPIPFHWTDINKPCFGGITGKVLIDDVDCILTGLFPDKSIEAITISSDDYNELETDNDSNYSDEIVKKLKKNVKKISENLDNCRDYNKYIAGLKAIEKSMEIIHNFDWKQQFSKYRVNNSDDTGSHYEVATWEQNSDNEVRNHKRYELKSPKNLNEDAIRNGVSYSNGKKHIMTDNEMDRFEEKFDEEMESMTNAFKKNMRVFEDMNKSFDNFTRLHDIEIERLRNSKVKTIASMGI